MERFTRVFGVPKLRVDFMRGMRFRLMLSYVLFFTVLLVVLGLFFRQTLQSETEGDVRDALQLEWDGAKGYLKIEKMRPVWIADETDPEEAFIVSRIKHVFLITDADGVPLDYDEAYDSIGIDSPAEVRRVLKLKEPEVHLRYDRSGTPYLIKAGRVPDEKGRPYFFAIGRSLGPARSTVERFTRSYFLLLPAMIAITGLLGWALAGRSLQPVNSVAQAAQNITGSNLSLKIPLRGAGDELDHLIDSFNRMTERLHQNFEQIRRFSTDVSHELRTPLTAIRGQLEVALFTAETPDQYREAMVNALEDVEKLSSIVRALLLLSQAESGQLVLQKTPLDLARSRRRSGGSVSDSGGRKRRHAFGHARPGRRFGFGRSHSDRASDLESAFERHQVHAKGWMGAVTRGRRPTGMGAAGRRRQRRRDCGRKSAAHFRSLLSGHGTPKRIWFRAWDWG